MAPTKVIYDTDPGVDDAMALMLIMASPDLELVGITTMLGNATVEVTTRNALYLKDRFNIPAPVAQGAANPLVIELTESPAHVHGVNGLGDIPMPEPITSKVHELPAHRFIIETVRKHPGEITIIAVGRMTNLALALREDPGIAALVKEVVIMGGAFGFFGHSGNVTPVAEANIAGDPHAADEMFAAPWKVTVVGLDVTQQCVMSVEYMERLRKDAGAVGEFIWDVSRHYQKFYLESTGLLGIPIHDSSAVAYVLDPTLYETREGPIRVVTEGIAIGQTIQKPKTRRFAATTAWNNLPDQAICVGVDSERFLDLYYKTVVAGSRK